jgi:flagellar biosynthetic protein FliR
MAIVLIFVTNFHHIMIMMIVESYALFQPGNFGSFTSLTGDMTMTFTRFMSASFLLGLQVGAPVTILGLVMMSAAGLINRLMPQIQVFFILQPLQLLLGFIVFTLSLSIVLTYYIQDFALKYQSLWNAG